MKIVNIIKAYLQHGDRFLVVEILKHFIRVSLIKTNFEERQLHLLKSITRPLSADDGLETVLETLKKLVASFGKISKYRIVLSLNPQFATTIHSSISLVREKSKIPIDDPDLDNLVSQAIWKFYDRQRGKVAVKMQINDLDVLLSDVQIKGIKLDGHKVVNPIGFNAKSVEFQFNATFTSRDCINGLKSILPREQVVFIGEDGSTLAYLLSHSHKESSFLAVNVFPEETALFVAKEGTINFMDTFPWGESALKKTLADSLSVSQEVAGEVMKKCALGQTSQFFMKRVEKFLLEELGVFAKGLEGFLSRAEVKTVYIQPFFHMPPVVFTQAFKNCFSQSVKVFPVHDGLISEKLEFNLKLNRGYEIPNSFSAISGIMASYFYPQSEQIKKIAKRRIRWLI